MGVLDFIAVGLIGALVGSGELASRYRDSPQRALLTPPAFIYVFLNIIACVFALLLIRSYGWTFGIADRAGAGAVRWTQILVAGFSAMALFRSALFTIRVGDKDLPIGPWSLLQVFRDVFDRTVDRIRAEQRSLEVCSVMKGLAYSKARESLPPYCFALMQNVPDDEQVVLVRSLKLLDQLDLPESVKLRIAGLQLMNLVGPAVLNAAVKMLRDELRDTSAKRSTP